MEMETSPDRRTINSASFFARKLFPTWSFQSGYNHNHNHLNPISYSFQNNHLRCDVFIMIDHPQIPVEAQPQELADIWSMLRRTASPIFRHSAICSAFLPLTSLMSKTTTRIVSLYCLVYTNS